MNNCSVHLFVFDTDRNVITSSCALPLEFDYETSKLLGLYSPTTLEAWFCDLVAKTA
jgi:hypothetical protein